MYLAEYRILKTFFVFQILPFFPLLIKLSFTRLAAISCSRPQMTASPRYSGLTEQSSTAVFQATGDIPVPREGEYVDLNTSCHHPLQVREGSNLSECLGPSASTSLTQLCDSSVASGQITLANRTLLITLSHTSSGGSLPVTTTTTTNIIIYYAVYSQFYS